MNPLELVRRPSRSFWQARNFFKIDKHPYKLACDTIEDRITLQRKWELIAFLNMVADLRPKTILEIGTYKGGNLRCMAAVCPDDSYFISLDMPGGTFGGGYSAEEAAAFKHFLKPTQRLDCIRMDSHAAEALEAVKTKLIDKPIDLLFVDGDHSENGVRDDFLLYAPLVRPGGLIAFHDIMPHKVHESCQVHLFWWKLVSILKGVELVDRDGFENWGGIGVIQVPTSGFDNVINKVRALYA
jgi:predicted O-methyltransferase YrrM